jgi:hypothetical protein
MGQPGVPAAIACLLKAEAFMNAVTYFTHPDQHTTSINTLDKLHSGSHHPAVMGDGIQESVRNQPCIFTGFTWVINHSTPRHCDTSGFCQGYNYLTVNGTATADLELSDLGLCLSYKAWDVVAFTGWILAHAVSQWQNQDWVCSVRWSRQSVVDEVLGIKDLQYPDVQDVAERLGVTILDSSPECLHTKIMFEKCSLRKPHKLTAMLGASSLCKP